VAASSLAFDVLAGPRPAAVIARYVDLTGHAPLPPPWTFGVWTNLIGGQQRVLTAARRLRALPVPVSVIWSYDAVDAQSGLGWPYPVYQRIRPGAYPDLPALTATLHRLGYKVLGYLCPNVTPGSPPFATAVPAGYVVRSAPVGTPMSSAGSGAAPPPRATAMPTVGTADGVDTSLSVLDLTNPAAVQWWQGNLRHILRDLGFDGWMQDLGDRLPPGARFADGRGAVEMANVYPLLYAQTAEAVARAVKPDALLFMRSGFAGSQRYVRAVWAGDQQDSWDPSIGLPAVIRPSFTLGGTGGGIAETEEQFERIAGAGLDVFEHEPIGRDHPLAQLEQVILTPHAASQSVEGMQQARRRVGEIAISVALGGLPDRKVVINKALYDRLAALPELASVPRV